MILLERVRKRKIIPKKIKKSGIKPLRKININRLHKEAEQSDARA